MAVVAECKQDAGEFEPLVNRARCEGKDDCVRVCPENVFELQQVPDDLKSALGPFARLKLYVHGGVQAFAVRAEACRACGKCVEACPERAITLRRRP